MGLDFSIIPKYMDVILLGCAWTIGITVAAALLSLFGGIVFAVIALYGPWILRQPFRLFAWRFMGTPLPPATVIDLLWLGPRSAWTGRPLSPVSSDLVYTLRSTIKS